MSQNETVTKTITEGDTRRRLADNLLDENGHAFNLDGHTVALRIVAELDDAIQVNDAAATIDNAAKGSVSFGFTPAQLSPAGIYWYWWIVTRTSDGAKEHFPGDGRKRRLNIVAKP